MQTKINTLKPELVQKIEQANNLAALDEIRVAALGKNGAITALMKELGALSVEEKKQAGQILNVFKTEIATALESKKKTLEEAEMNAKLAAQKVDVTLPARPDTIGRIHPVSQVMEEMLTIFAQMGFDLAEGPDIEDDWHNFEALNIPPSHPARQMQATFLYGRGSR